MFWLGIWYIIVRFKLVIFGLLIKYIRLMNYVYIMIVNCKLNVIKKIYVYILYGNNVLLLLIELFVDYYLIYRFLIFIR